MALLSRRHAGRQASAEAYEQTNRQASVADEESTTASALLLHATSIVITVRYPPLPAGYTSG